MARTACAIAVKRAPEQAVDVAPSFVNRQPIAIRHSKGTIQIGPDPRKLSCGHETGIPEEAEWVSLEADEGFTIAFDKGDGSPFADETFKVPAGGSVSSGRITGAHGTYRYTVYDRHEDSKDPAIIVTP